VLEKNIPLLLSLVNQLGVTIENAQLRQRAEQLLVVEERNRLARELHDSVTQSLYSATLFAEAGLKQAQNGRVEKAITYLEDVLQAGRQALKEMRLLVYRLRPFSLDEGLVPALEHRLKAVEERAGIGQQLKVNGSAVLSADVEETLYYIAVEALNNALKHAQATAVQVVIDQDDAAVTLQVKDNGQGFDTAAALSSGGLGLTSMKERAAQYQGTVNINSAVNQGTVITVTLPMRALRRKNER
ncbi:MAG: sensor histidine kinase, partial [Anaerolineales bacterium]|nr:sensor histidine kinase [Anaerolineales bacterium]